jgi:hypothetical protein
LLVEHPARTHRFIADDAVLGQQRRDDSADLVGIERTGRQRRYTFARLGDEGRSLGFRAEFVGQRLDRAGQVVAGARQRRDRAALMGQRPGLPG